MPEIQLRGNALDPVWIWAVMHFPNDERMRRAYYALRFTELELSQACGSESAEFPTTLINDLIAAPSHTELLAKVVTSTKRGIVAGDILSTMFLMSAFPNEFPEPSMRKAVFVAQAFAKESSYGDGSPLSTSVTAIRKYFDEFSAVAHYWAAFRMHQMFPIREHREMLNSAKAVRDFLGIAGLFQDFGCSFSAERPKVKELFLDGQSVWRVPDSIPRLVPPIKSVPDRLLETVRKYEAAADR